MSQRAAWQLERFGFAEVYDFVVGKAHWMASGRPTVRSEPIARVGSFVTAATTAHVDDTVAAVRKTTCGTSCDVVIIDENRIVMGRVRRAELGAASDSDQMTQIMRPGPTTIRPDELVNDVTSRMARRGVTSILVTRPTGELLGEFAPNAEDRHD